LKIVTLVSFATIVSGSPNEEPAPIADAAPIAPEGQFDRLNECKPDAMFVGADGADVKADACRCKALTCDDADRADVGGSANPTGGETCAADAKSKKDRWYQCSVGQTCVSTGNNGWNACLYKHTKSDTKPLPCVASTTEKIVEDEHKAIKNRQFPAQCLWSKSYGYSYCYTTPTGNSGWFKCSDQKQSLIVEAPTTPVVDGKTDGKGDGSTKSVDGGKGDGKVDRPPTTKKPPQSGQSGAASYGISAAAIMTFMTFFF